MPESWFELSPADQSEALEVAAARSGRPAHLLEKDIWVVWALAAIYNSPLGDTLTFKGGTSLSKVYKVIDRFSGVSEFLCVRRRGTFPRCRRRPFYGRGRAARWESQLRFYPRLFMPEGFRPASGYSRA